MIQLTKTVVFNDHEIKERFVRAMGPGGQNVKKEASAVELRLDIGKSSLPPDLKERLIALTGRHVTKDGVLVVVSRAHRSQVQNRDDARARLVTLLKRAATPQRNRKATTPLPAVRQRNLISKQQHSAVKRSRSKRAAD